MQNDDPKATLHDYLRTSRETLLWKLDGLGEYDVRRPLVPTGTNLLGLVKHLATVEAGYFGLAFDRPYDEDLPIVGPDGTPNADMWATADESRELILDRYRRVCQHADATIEALQLTAAGVVPWWPGERGRVTLHRILVHVLAETNRHLGHADLVRELIDGQVGYRASNPNTPSDDAAWWTAHYDRVENAARAASRR